MGGLRKGGGDFDRGGWSVMEIEIVEVQSRLSVR